jgi:hypothetical protein
VTRLCWDDGRTRVYGSVTTRTSHTGRYTLTVRWDDGRVGTFVEGQEPDELHIAAPVDIKAAS